MSNTKKRYILIDTNIFVQCCLLEKKIDDDATIDSLLQILENDQAILLLPEIIKKEFYKSINPSEYEKWAEDFKKNYIQLSQSAQTQEPKNKLQKSQQSKPEIKLSEKLTLNWKNSIDNFLRNQIKSFKNTQKKIESIFNHKNTKDINFKQKDFFDAYKFYISGQKPIKIGGHAIQSDGIIVAGLYSFLKKKNNYELIICSNNYNDFADDKVTDDQGLENQVALHPHIKTNIKGDVKLYMYLSVLLNKEFATSLPTEEKKAEKTEVNETVEDELVGQSK